MFVSRSVAREPSNSTSLGERLTERYSRATLRVTARDGHAVQYGGSMLEEHQVICRGEIRSVPPQFAERSSGSSRIPKRPGKPCRPSRFAARRGRAGGDPEIRTGFDTFDQDISAFFDRLVGMGRTLTSIYPSHTVLDRPTA